MFPKEISGLSFKASIIYRESLALESAELSALSLRGEYNVQMYAWSRASIHVFEDWLEDEKFLIDIKLKCPQRQRDMKNEM